MCCELLPRLRTNLGLCSWPWTWRLPRWPSPTGHCLNAGVQSLSGPEHYRRAYAGSLRQSHPRPDIHTLTLRWSTGWLPTPGAISAPTRNDMADNCGPTIFGLKIFGSYLVGNKFHVCVGSQAGLKCFSRFAAASELVVSYLTRFTKRALSRGITSGCESSYPLAHSFNAIMRCHQDALIHATKRLQRLQEQEVDRGTLRGGWLIVSSNTRQQNTAFWEISHTNPRSKRSR